MPSNESKLENQVETLNTGPKLGVRHIQALLLFLLLSAGYAMRVCLSVGIVAMTDDSTTENPDVPVYTDWNEKSVILSSFFWGYVILQVPAGEIGKKYGAKWFLIGAMVINSVACLIIPAVADSLGPYGLIVCRVVQGLSQGFFYPNVHNLMGKWAPSSERSMLGSFVFAGSSFGTVVGMPITAMISASWVGWPVSFYLFGGLGLLWCVFWAIWGFDSPQVHPTITAEEKSYIENSLGTTENVKPPRTPWKAIFTSLPVWAIIVGSFGQNWGYSALLTEIPNYLSKVMKYDMESNGWLSAAPYFALFIFSSSFGPLADYLFVRGYLSRRNVRKVSNTIGNVIPAIALAFLGFVPNDKPGISVTLLIIAVGVNGAVYCGFQVNHVDLSPKYAGTLMGITNGSSNIFSIISPLVVQAVVTDETDRTLWRIIFLTAAGVYIVSDIFYIIYAAGERQWWDENEHESEAKPRHISIDADLGNNNAPTTKY